MSREQVVPLSVSFLFFPTFFSFLGGVVLAGRMEEEPPCASFHPNITIFFLKHLFKKEVESQQTEANTLWESWDGVCMLGAVSSSNLSLRVS